MRRQEEGAWWWLLRTGWWEEEKGGWEGARLAGWKMGRWWRLGNSTD